jgi:hypothetical protein
MVEFWASLSATRSHSDHLPRLLRRQPAIDHEPGPNLTFPILSDTKGEVSAAFALRFRLPDYRIELYKG